jgi:hypothetical protein
MKRRILAVLEYVPPTFLFEYFWHLPVFALKPPGPLRNDPQSLCSRFGVDASGCGIGS